MLFLQRWLRPDLEGKLLMRRKRKASNRFFDARASLGLYEIRGLAGNEKVQNDIFDERATLCSLLRTEMVVRRI